MILACSAFFFSVFTVLWDVGMGVRGQLLGSVSPSTVSSWLEVRSSGLCSKVFLLDEPGPYLFFFVCFFFKILLLLISFALLSSCSPS